MKTDHQFIEKNLGLVLAEIVSQPEAASFSLSDSLSYQEQIGQLTEWLEDAGEYRLVYENVVSMLEVWPLNLSGKVAIKLLEVGLISGFKTGLEPDKGFNRRQLQES